METRKMFPDARLESLHEPSEHLAGVYETREKWSAVIRACTAWELHFPIFRYL
jgi:hypothetical protein